MSAILGWLALRDVDWAATGGAFLSVSWMTLVAATAVMLYSGVFHTIRWKLLLPDEQVSVARLFLVKNAGQSVNILVPVRVAGDATELTMLTQSDGISGSTVVTSIFVGRVLDLTVTTLVMAAGILWIPQLSVFRPALVPVMLPAVGIVLLFLYSGWFSRTTLARRFAIVQSTLGSIGRWRGRKPRLLVAAVAGAGSWVSLGIGAWLIAQALGIDMPFWLMPVLFVIMTAFTSVIPAGPGSLGVFEFTTTYVLGLFAVEASAALAFALVLHAMVLLPPLAIGIPVLASETETLRRTTDSVRRYLVRKGKRPDGGLTAGAGESSMQRSASPSPVCLAVDDWVGI